jgi:hypothetical protein
VAELGQGHEQQHVALPARQRRDRPVELAAQALGTDPRCGRVAAAGASRPAGACRPPWSRCRTARCARSRVPGRSARAAGTPQGTSAPRRRRRRPGRAAWPRTGGSRRSRRRRPRRSARPGGAEDPLSCGAFPWRGWRSHRYQPHPAFAFRPPRPPGETKVPAGLRRDPADDPAAGRLQGTNRGEGPISDFRAALPRTGSHE